MLLVVGGHLCSKISSLKSVKNYIEIIFGWFSRCCCLHLLQQPTFAHYDLCIEYNGSWISNKNYITFIISSLSYYAKCLVDSHFSIAIRLSSWYYIKIIINALNLRILLFLLNIVLLKYLCHNECFTTSAFVKQRHLWMFPIYMKRMHKKVIIRKLQSILLKITIWIS